MLFIEFYFNFIIQSHLLPPSWGSLLLLLLLLFIISTSLPSTP